MGRLNLYWLLCLVIFYLFLPTGYHSYYMSPEGMAQGSQVHVDKEEGGKTAGQQEMYPDHYFYPA